MRVVLCWGGVSGYMAACWRELSARPGVELQVITFGGQNNTAFDEQGLMAGVDHRALSESSPDALLAAVRAFRPDVIGVAGWMHRAYFGLASNPGLRQVPMIMAMDTPLLRTWRQYLARYRLRRYLDRMARVVVPGERGWQYARFLGIPEARIRRGVYGINYAALAPLYERRLAENGGEWPKGFLFLGRLVPEKGLDVLMEAYGAYRSAVPDPWPLACCGLGPLRPLLSGQAGVEDVGFVQPAQVTELMVRHGALVLPSRFDPWPLVVVEACGAGLPVICTEACGSAVELVRDGYNGFTAATDNTKSFAGALVRAHQARAGLAEMGRRAQAFAEAYSAPFWAQRWEHLLRELLE